MGLKDRTHHEIDPSTLELLELPSLSCLRHMHLTAVRQNVRLGLAIQIFQVLARMIAAQCDGLIR